MSQEHDNVETQVMDEETDVHPIPRTVTPPAIKPKKVLTEAQKLAFLKGREKRAANIQQRKLEKAKQEDHPDIIPTTPPKSKSASSSIDVDYDLIAEKVAEQLAAKQKKWITTPPPSPPPLPKRRTYVRRTESDVTSSPPPPPPPPPPASKFASRIMAPTPSRPTTEFNWM